MRTVVVAAVFGFALLLGLPMVASAQLLGPATTTTVPPPTTVTSAVAPTTTATPKPATPPAPPATAPPATTPPPRRDTPTTAGTAPSTAPAFVPPAGVATTTPAPPSPVLETGGRRVLPIFVLLSIGGFALTALIMAAQWVATRRPPTASGRGFVRR